MSDDDSGHEKRPYLAVMIILAVLTLIEVQTPQLAARGLVVPLLMAIATAKAAFVVAYYMHLRYEPNFLRVLPVVPLALVFILLLALFFGVTPV